ncbi:MAG: exo-alpha-sialidase [Planctomycetales bacterium]|nr:exo-alpha-sialidase [Planctomycetales bacterium]
MNRGIRWIALALTWSVAALVSQRGFAQGAVTLQLPPTESNPRNSEGDFVQLKDGRLLFIYTHFTGGSGDASSAYLAGRFSADDGRTWDATDTAMEFTPQAVLLGHCVGDRTQNNSLALTQITRLELQDLPR